MFRIGHPGGLGNRLDLITTGYVLAKENRLGDLEVLWPITNAMPASFFDLFSCLPGGRVVDCEVSPNDVGQFETIVLEDYYRLKKALPQDYRDSQFYGEMLATLMAKAHPELQSEAAAFVEENFQPASSCGLPTIGVNIRREEPAAVVKEVFGLTSRGLSPITPADFATRQLCEFAQPLRYYEAVMKSFPQNTRFFISTDSQEAFQWIRGRFGNRVFQHPRVHDNRTSVAGVREWMVEMLLLSRCAAVVGTGRSSAAYMAARAGGRPLLSVKTFPKIPADWPSFNRWRWLWAYRHILVESTFWRTWLFYVVRPRAVRIAKIPGKIPERFLRIARKCISQPRGKPSEKITRLEDICVEVVKTRKSRQDNQASRPNEPNGIL